MKGVGKVKGNQEETTSTLRLTEINCSPPDLQGQREAAVTKWWKELQQQAEARPLTGSLAAFLRGIQPLPTSSAARKAGDNISTLHSRIFTPCLPRTDYSSGKPESKGAWGMLTIEANLLQHRAFQGNESWRHRQNSRTSRVQSFVSIFLSLHFLIQSHKISFRIFNV